MLRPVDFLIRDKMNHYLLDIENILKADCITINGPIDSSIMNLMLHVVEELKEESDSKSIFIILTTTGGDAIIVERIVNILRHHYDEVNFIIPDFAYSAGTIFCMSGDNIYMDYFSILGPIDPQVMNKDGKFVPALGYLEKVDKLIVKAQEGTLTEAEFLILSGFDLSELNSYEQARNLTVDLLKTWLVKYKFKNWVSKSGEPKSEAEKTQTAIKIADKLSDYSTWKSHGRPLSMAVLEQIGLRIEDYSKTPELHRLIREYQQLCLEYIGWCGCNLIHTRRFL